MGTMTALNAFRNSTLGDLLSIQATRYSNCPFLSMESDGELSSLSYAQVEHQAASLAAGLRQAGLLPGDRLAIVLPNIPAYVITLFAAAKAGLIVVPINVRRRSAGVLLRLSKTRSKAVVTFSDPKEYNGMDHLAMILDVQDGLPDLKNVIALSPFKKSRNVIAWDDLLIPTGTLPAPTAKPGDPVAIVHTLGSSGEPRGAILAHSSLVHNAAALAEIMKCSSEDIVLGTVPFSNSFGLTATILASAVAGAQLVCLPKYNPANALDLIERYGITIHHGVPTMFALELNQPNFNPKSCASLRTGIMAGAHCPPDLVKRVRNEMGSTILIGYGLTEASPAVTMTHLDDGPVTATETVGRPLEGVEIKVIGADGAALSFGKEGELCARGYNIMQGYWENPEATAQTLGKEGWLHTGDLAVIEQDGPVRIIGRKDEVINRGGFKVHPSSIEMVLRAFPGVKEAAVVGVPDLIYGQLACACVVRQQNVELTAEDLLAYAAQRLGDFAVPDRVVFFDALPRHYGVVQKEYLRERVRIRGFAWRFGRNIDTDAIIPARRCNSADPRELALYCMEDADPHFVEKMRRGDIIVAETNFGCGSSREVAPLTIKAAGISAVIAKSFARIFFRNSINIGLPILECPQAVDGIREGDEVEVEPATGTIRNLSRNETYYAEPFPDFLQHIIDQGGLLAYVENRLAGNNQ